MKCINCGAELPDGSSVCFECGAAQNKAADPIVTNTAATQNTKGNSKCKNCGADLPEGTTVCFECGAPQNFVNTNNGSAAPQGSFAGAAKSKVLAAILAFLFGCYGLDQFYLGFVKTGVLRIVVSCLTVCVGGMIWGFVDCFRIATGAVTVDAKGNPII